MTTPSDFEQEVLELLNRVRLNPGAEFDALIVDAASRTAVSSSLSSALAYFGVDMTALRTQFAAFAPVAPLAWNAALNLSASRHSAAMIAQDSQSHHLPGEASLRDRVVDAGYSQYGALAENIYAYASSPLYTHAGFYIDWGYDAVDFGTSGALLTNFKTLGDGIQDKAGHRKAMMSADYTEVGIAAIAETDPLTEVGPWVVTENFGSQLGYQQKLLGVVFDDSDGDRFYDAGEGLSGVSLRATPLGGGADILGTTWSSGGYQLVLAPGSYQITFASPSLPAAVMRTVTIAAENLKLDLNADDVPTDPDALIGTAAANWLEARASGHLIDGLGGIDMVSFVNAAARAVLDLNTGSALVGDQTYTLRGLENVTGSIWDDLITGDAGPNRIRAMGNYDWMIGSGGRDTFEGGSGRDTVAYSAASAGVVTSLLTDTGVGGQAIGDRYYDVENLTGSSHADRLAGDNDVNILRGLAGDDFIFGHGGNDNIDGGAGRDSLDGGLGNDRLTGGRGNDMIIGGQGWDTAVFSAARAQYTVGADASGRTSVLHAIDGLDGLDILNGVEVVQFSDMRLYL